MCTKPIKELFVTMAEKADVVTIDGGSYCHYGWDKIRNEKDNALLSVTWHDAEGEEFRSSITEEAFELENHPSFDFGTGIFRLIDGEGDPTKVRFYRLELLKG